MPTDAAAADTVEQQQVVLRVVGSGQALTLLESTASELFRRLGIKVAVVSISDDAPASATPPLAIATIEITPPLCSIVILDGASGGELDRRTFTENSVETAVEAAAHIAYFVVENQLEAAEAERERARAAERERERELERERQRGAESTAAPATPANEPAPVVVAPATEAETVADGNEPTPPAGDRGSVGVDLGLGFSVTSLGSGRVRPGSALIGEVRFPSLGVPVGLLVAATTHAASELEFQGATAELRPSVLRLLATLDVPLGSALALAVGAGGSMEWLRLTPTKSADGVQVSNAESMFEGLLTGVAGLRIKLGERAFLTALGGIDIGLNPTTFMANTEAGEEVILHMPSIRPVMLVGAEASLDQSPRFSAGAP